jgi:SAM-dependent methyltransferase
VFEPNAAKLLSRLRPDDRVLDIGGWACPFNRAQWILDAEPYETRGFYRTFGGPPNQGGTVEWFSKETWIRRDICAKEPYPFPDKFFDFVVCSHTLEDIRDPLWVCSEMIRIGKSGYIEVPSRIAESCRGVESPRIVGLSHHRWLIEIKGTHIQFLQKFGLIHSHWRFSLPGNMRGTLRPEEAVQCLWWSNHFTFEEVTIHGLPNVETALASWVQSVHPYPGWLLALDSWTRGALRQVKRFRAAIVRRLPYEHQSCRTDSNASR